MPQKLWMAALLFPTVARSFWNLSAISRKKIPLPFYYYCATVILCSRWCSCLFDVIFKYMVLQKPAPTLEVLLQRYFFLCKVIFCQEKTNSATFPLLLLLPNKFHLLLLFSTTFEKSSSVFRYLATLCSIIILKFD